MTHTQTCENTQPLPEPVYYTKAEIEKATLAAYKAWRRNGSEDSALQDAATFYAYHLTKLHLRQLEESRAIETVCAWCKCHLSGPVGAAPENVSHGICAACAVNMEPELAVA